MLLSWSKISVLEIMIGKSEQDIRIGFLVSIHPYIL